jgi:hypothetical protein
MPASQYRAMSDCVEASFAETTIPPTFPQGSHCTNTISHVLPIDFVQRLLPRQTLHKTFSDFRGCGSEVYMAVLQ